MAWLTTTHLLPFMTTARLNKLVDDDGDATADTAIVTAVLAQAEAEVLGVLAHAGLSFDEDAVPASVTRLGAEIAVDLFHQRRRDTYSEGDKLAHDALMERLQAIRERREHLAGTTRATLAYVDQVDPVMTGESDEGW